MILSLIITSFLDAFNIVSSVYFYQRGNILLSVLLLGCALSSIMITLVGYNG